MAYKKKAADSGADDNKTKFYSGSTEQFSYKRDRAQTINFAKDQEILQRNASRNYTRTYTQYTKDLVKTYLQSPTANQDTLRDISRFLCRNSSIYNKMIMYLASMPLFHYTITQANDLSEEIDQEKALKDYQKVLENFNRFNIKKEGYTALYIAIRDGIYVGFSYDDTQGKTWMMPLDVQYCRIVGKNEYGEWVVYFNANYFNQGNNSEFVLGIEGNPNTVTWDQVFVDGYNAFQNDRNAQWFRLPTERTLCFIVGADDEFASPLPYFLPLFTDLLDLLDLQQILQSKTELENYALIVNKIPLVDNGNSSDIDDFAVSMEMVNYFRALEEQAVPDLVGVITAPFDVEKIMFDDSRQASDTDALAKSIRNMFSNSGLTQNVVSGGDSTSNIAIKFAQLADQSNVWVWVNRIESWLNFYIAENISKGHILEILRVTWFNEDDYIEKYRMLSTLGGPALDYLAVVEGSPYKAINKIRFENAIGIKDIMIPLQSSYNSSSDSAGRPRSSDDKLSPSAERTRNTSSDIT